MPSTIFQSDDAKTKVGGRLFDYCQNGNIFYVNHNPFGVITFYYSTNGGVTWSAAATTLTDGLVGSLFQSATGFFIDKDDYAHILYNAGSDFGYRRGTPNASRTDYTWSSLVYANTPGFGHEYGALDIVAHREGTGWVAHCIMGEVHTSTAGVVDWVPIYITSGGTISKGTSQEIISWGYNVGSLVSVDFHHETADPKAVQGSAPHLYVAHTTNDSNQDTYITRLAYSGGAWTVGSSLPVSTADNAYWINPPQLFYDGTRIVVVYTFEGSYATLRCFERDEANTTTTIRSVTATGGGYGGGLYSYGCGYDNDQNIHVFVSEDTSGDFLKSRYLRSGGTWGTWSVVEASSGLPEYSLVSVARGIQPLATGRNQLGVVYPQRDTTPDSMKYDTLVAGVVFEAILQGVATMTPDPKLAMTAGQNTLQGVGTLSAITAAVMRPDTMLQGVGSLGSTTLFNPKKDFTVYDGYIDNPDSGTIPFIYFEDDSAKPQTVSRPLSPPRTDVGGSPTEVRPESGEIFSQQDFSHGAGQLYFHHEGRDVQRFLWSEGFEVEIDTVGQPTLLHHLNDVPTAAVSSATVGKIEVFNDFPFIIDGASIRKGSGDFPGFWSSESPGGTPQDMVSSGEYLYAALGAAGIARRDTAGAWSIWQATPLATRIAWVKNRIMASDGAVIYEITDIVRTVETLPAGWVFESIFEAGGFIYAVANNASSGLSRISTYGLNTSGDAIEKKNETPFPRNQLMYSGRGFLGSVYIGGGIKNSSEGFDPVVYQAFPQENGALTYLKVNEGEGAGAIDLSVKALEPIGEDIVFGWSLGSGFDFGARDGLAIHKPKVDAFLGHLKKTGAGAGKQVLGIALYRGRLLFTLKGDGLYYEDTTHFVDQAQLWTSVADWNTTAKKSWDTIQVSHNRLPASTSVRAEYSTRLPSEGTWNPGVFSDVDDSEVAEANFTDVVSQMISLRLTSLANPGKTEAPSGLGFLVRSNVIPDHPEFGLSRYVRLVNKDRKDSDAPMVFNDVAAVRRKLHNLAYQWVTLYEPGVVWTLHVDSVAEVQPFLVEYDATLGEGQAQGYVVQLTMTGTRD